MIGFLVDANVLHRPCRLQALVVRAFTQAVREVEVFPVYLVCGGACACPCVRSVRKCLQAPPGLPGSRCATWRSVAVRGESRGKFRQVPSERVFEWVEPIGSKKPLEGEGGATVGCSWALGDPPTPSLN